METRDKKEIFLFLQKKYGKIGFDLKPALYFLAAVDLMEEPDEVFRMKAEAMELRENEKKKLQKYIKAARGFYNGRLSKLQKA